MDIKGVLEEEYRAISRLGRTVKLSAACLHFCP